MIKRISLVLLVVCVFTVPGYSKKVGDVNLPNTVKVASDTLMLNGAGIREKFWVDVYATGLYLKKKSANASAIINANEAMSIKIHIISSRVNKKNFVESLNEGFGKAMGGNTAPLKAEIDKFKTFFTAKIVPGNVFDMEYAPGQGLIVKRNGQVIGTINNLNFKKAFFRIYLGNNPADKGVKKAMLGR